MYAKKWRLPDKGRDQVQLLNITLFLLRVRGRCLCGHRDQLAHLPCVEGVRGPFKRRSPFCLPINLKFTIVSLPLIG